MTLDFDKANGLVPAIIQDAMTNKVLMLGYLNEEAWEKTTREGVVTFFSRTRNRLWTKGETSGNFLHVVDVEVDCDQDTVLIKVKPDGPVCHTGTDTCFKDSNRQDLTFLSYLQKFLQERHTAMPEGSYTTRLFQSGTPKIAQKVGEEAVELVIESLLADNEEAFLGEAADLIYHLLVLLIDRGNTLDEVARVLESRHQ